MGKLIPLGILVLAAMTFYSLRDGFDPNSIRNKRVLVTGASSGIGEQLAYQYARLGARLVITARRAELLAKVVLKCKGLGAQQVESVPADMAVVTDRTKVVRETERVLGGLDHLILNHGIYKFATWIGTPENMTNLDKYLEINFFSYVDVASQAFEMLKASSGNIGVVSSVVGKVSMAPMAPYVSTKHALHGFFSSWRQELAFKNIGISITLCVLGLVDTEKALEVVNQYHADADTSTAASAKDTAAAILRSITLEAYEMYYPKMAAVYVTVKQFLPGYLENYI